MSPKDEHPRNRDVVVIGGSAGGLEALMTIARGLPADFPAAVFVALHRGEAEPNLLSDILRRNGPLLAISAEEGMPFEPGVIYVAPVDRHLLLGRDHVHVRRGPRENRMRPAVDPLFRSAAANCSTRVIAVVLSGGLNDGTAGLRAIQQAGGLAVVQDPKDCLQPDMPRSAIDHTEPDYILPAAEMPALLERLVSERRPPEIEVSRQVRMEALIAAQELTTMPDQYSLGKLSPLSCPDCHGVMYEIEDGNLIRFRCHTGHAFTLESAHAAAADTWEKALYEALRVQQEQAMLMRSMIANARQRGRGELVASLERRERSYQEGVEIVRQLLARTENPAPD